MGSSLSRHTQPENTFVTGASCEIGRKICEYLADSIFFLVNIVGKKQSDIDKLSVIPNIEGIRMEVTDPEDISRLVDLG
ncbi:MAG: hypothetical protein IH840_07065 [Candidatus Heimdallarchaeota archaeon]|nr:hypothetical protein [Candidatus Heimdallarchaeota archaeon]